MPPEQQIKQYDGDDEIVFSGIFNIYDNKITIENILGYKFVFTFDEQLNNEQPPKDIAVAPLEGEIGALVKLSAKIRNSSIGSGTTNKNEIVNFEDGRKLLWSMFVQTIGNDKHALNVSLTFYLRHA